MITVNDILIQFQTLKTRITEYYTLISGEVDADATLDDLDSTSKTSDWNLWMWMFAAMCIILDGIWADRQAEISAKVDEGIPGTDLWLQLEMFKFQYGDSLLWNSVTGKYYYAVIDATKQIIARCAIVSSGGITSVKVAKLSGGSPVALSGPELTAFRTYAHKIQWSGAKVFVPLSIVSDKLKAPMDVYYDGTKPIADIQAIVEAAWISYLDSLPFNGEYSINKHGDFVENASTTIIEVNMGAVMARADAGSLVPVVRVYNPVSGYLDRDPAFDFSDMINYFPV